MTRKQSLIVLGIAVLAGGVASVLSLLYLAESAEDDPLTIATEVAVAARPLPPGRVLGEADVAFVPWATEAVPAGLFTSAASLVGRTVLDPIGTGEPVLGSALAPEGAGSGVPGLIPQGMRAVSIRVDEVIGVNGFVSPGSTVDVLAVLDNPGGESISRVVLQNVEVIAVGERLQADPAVTQQLATVVTLLVTPEQAERLALATHQGRIQLALRGTLDRIQLSTDPLRTSELTGIRPSAPSGSPSTQAAAAAPRPVSPRPIETTARVSVQNVPGQAEARESAGAGSRGATVERSTSSDASVPVIQRTTPGSSRTVEVINGTQRTIVTY